MRWIRSHLHGSTLRFFIYTLVCLVFLGWLVVRIGNIQLFSHRTEYHALMADVTGLNQGDQVKLAGVAVGQVSGITTHHGQAEVSFAVDHDVKLPADTEVGIRWHNVLGQKYLYLYPSGDSGPYLAAGATIPASHDQGDADLGEFLNALGPVIQSINPAEANAFVQGVLGGLQGNLDQVGSLIDNAATVSDTVGNLQLQVGQVIDNLSVVVGSLGGRSQDLQQVVSNLATISSALASRNDTLDAVIGNFGQVSGEFAQLVSANRGNLDTIISSLQTVASAIHAHRQDLNADLSTLSAGLEPYTLISSYGQWFDVNVVYQCLADESSCSYQESGAKPTQVQSSSADNGTALQSALLRVAGEIRMNRLRNIFRLNFTERNPVTIGAVAVAIVLAFVFGALFLNRNFLGGGADITARFGNAAGLRGGDQVLLAGVPVGSVVSLDEHGAYVYAHLRVGGSVQLPNDSSATIEVETLLGQLAVKLVAGNNWTHLLHSGATITNTSVPVEFQQLQNATGPLLAQSNGPALNQLLGDLASVTKDKQSQVARIIAGLDKLTTTVSQRQAEVSQLIDASNQVAGALQSRQTQLVSVIDNFNTVLAGLSQRQAQISTLIKNTEAVASQTSSLVGANRAKLDNLLSTLQDDLNVVAAHQVDLAQGVSYLASAIQGFASIGYSGPSNYPNSWANVFTNLLNGGDAVYGSCGYLDQALDVALGPDPTPCSARTGPQNTVSSGGAATTSQTSAGGAAALAGMLGSLGGAP